MAAMKQLPGSPFSQIKPLTASKEFSSYEDYSNYKRMNRSVQDWYEVGANLVSQQSGFFNSGFKSSDDFIKHGTRYNSQVKHFFDMADKYRSDFKDNSEALDGINSLTSVMTEVQNASKGYADFMKQFKSRDDYNTQALYPSKYSGSSSADIEKRITELSGGKGNEAELNWLKQNKYAYYTADELKQREKELQEEIKQSKNRFEPHDTQKPAGKAAGMKAYTDENDALETELAIVQNAYRDAAYREQAEKWDEDHRRRFYNHYGAWANKVSRETQSTRVNMGDAVSGELDAARKGVAEMEDYLRKQGYSQDEINSFRAYAQQQDNSSKMYENARYWQDVADEGFWGKVAASVASIPANLISGMAYADALLQRITNPTDAFTGATRAVDYNASPVAYASENMRSAVSKDMSAAGQFFYSTGMSIADFIAAGGIMKATGTVGKNVKALGKFGTRVGNSAEVMLAGSAANAGMRAAKERGATDAEALGFGFLNGLAEMAGEHISIEHLGTIERAMGNAAGRRSAANIFKSIGLQAAVEGSEEGVTTIANTLADLVIMGDRSEYNLNVEKYLAAGETDEDARRHAFLDWLGGLALDVAGGAISGGVTSGVTVGISAAKQKASGAPNVEDKSAHYLLTIDKALSYPEGSRTRKLADSLFERLDKADSFDDANIKGKEISKLSRLMKKEQSLLNEMAEATTEDTEAESLILEALDQPEESAAYILANRLREKQLEGESITDTEKDALEKAMTSPLPAATTEESARALELKNQYTQAMLDGTLTEKAIYDAIDEANAGEKSAEAIIEAEIAQQAERVLKTEFLDELRAGELPDESIKAAANYVAKGGTTEAAIDTINKILKGSTNNEKGKQSSDEGVGRQPDMGTGEQAGRIHEGTGRTEENKRTERSSESAQRKDIPKAHRVSSKELGLKNGTDAKSLDVIAEDKLHPATQRIIKAFSKAATSFTAVKGRFETKNGTIQGVTTADGKVIFRTDTAYGQEAILLHECGHLYIRDDSSLKAALKDACTEAMTENELRELSVKYGSLWQGLMSESMTDDEFLDMMLEEIYCDALAGIDRIRARGAGKLTEAVRSVFEQETGIDVDALLNDAETAKTEAKTETAKAPAKETRNNGPPKHSVEDLPDGKKYVRADRQVIFGNDPEVWSEQLENYINGKIRRGQDVQLTTEDGDVLTLTKDTAGKVSSRYKDGRTMSDEAFERKVSAGAHIDELAQVSTRGKKITADTDGRHGNMASGGWNYRTAYFRDFDGTYYRCIISVSIGKNGNAVYNIGEMEERSFPTARKALSGSSAKSGALGRETSFESSIRNLDDDVKSQYSIDDDLPINLQLVLNGDFDAKSNEVHIGTTSNFLTKEIGAEALDLYMPAEKAYRAMVTEERAVFEGKPTGSGINYHGLGLEGLVDILNASEEPIAAFADTPSKGNKRENRIVLVTDVKAQGGLGVVIEELDTKARSEGKKIRANKAITVYPKGNIQAAIQEAIADDRILYLDEKRSQTHLAVRKGANYPTAARKADFANNIRRFWENVKWKKSGKAGYTAESTTEELPEWKKKLMEFSEERYSSDDEGLRIRAGKMSQSNLKERIARVEGMIHGYEMSDSLTERAKEELETLKRNRDILNGALEEKKAKAREARASEREAGREAAANMQASPSAITKSANKLADNLLDSFNVIEKRGEVRGFISATLKAWQERGHFTKQDVERLEDKLLTYGSETVEADDTASEFRHYVQASHIYVPPRVVAEFGDDWKSIRNRAFGAGIYLSTKVEGFGGIDTHYMEFADEFGKGLFREDTDERAMLEQIVNMAEDGKAENMNLYSYAKHLNDTERTGDSFLDSMHNKLMEELKAFSQSAKIEMQVKADSAYQMAKDRAHRERVLQQTQQRRAEVEFQKKALKQLQLLKRNARKAPAELKAEMDELLKDINIITVSTANAMNYSNKYEATWGNLVNMYLWAKKSDPNFLPTKELENIVMRTSGISLDSMTPEQVQSLYTAAVALNTAYYNRNNYIGDELHRSYSEISESVEAEMKSAAKPKNRYGKARKYVRDTYNPMQYLESLTGWNPDSVFYKTLAKGLETGERRMRRYQEEANQILDKFLKENREWMKKADGQGKDGIWYTVEVPQLVELKMGEKPIFGESVTINMTPLQKVMLALESKNADNLAHMAGGRTFVNKTEYQKGNIEDGLKDGETVKLAPETVKALVSDLTAEEQELFDILAKYYNDFAKTRINEVSNTLYGYDRAMSAFYAPIFTNENYNMTEPGVYDVTAEGVGHLKERTDGAKTPSYNISAIEAFRRHVAQTSRFVGLSIPIQNFNRVLNWRVNNGKTVKDVITHEWTAGDVKYINNILTELQASTHMEKIELENMLDAVESNYISAVFGFNPSVALKVFGSWFTAGASLDFKYAASLGKVNEDIINKYTSELAIRQRGYSTPELAQMQLRGGKVNDFIQGHRITRDVLGGGWMVKADVAVAKSLWNWASAQVKATTNLAPGTQAQIESGTDPFYKAVAEIYEEAISNTQSMYDVMHRSQTMKKTGVSKALTMFHTDTMQCLNLLYKNIGEARYYASRAKSDPKNKELQKKSEAASKKVGSTFAAVALCSLEVTIITVLNAMLKRRDKYEDEEGNFDWGILASDSASNFLKSLTGMLPGWDVLMNAGIDWAFGDKTFDTQVPGLTMLNDLVDASMGLLQKAREGKKLSPEDFKDLALTLAKGGGLPFENVEKYLVGIMSWASPELSQAYDDLWATPKKADLNKMSDGERAQAVYDMLKEYDIDKDSAEELARLYSAGYTKAVAGDIPESITVDGEEFVLSKDDTARYKEVLGETLSKLDDVINSKEYKNADDKEKSDMLRRVNEFAHATAKAAVCESYDPPAWVHGGQDLIDMGKGIMSVATMPYSSTKEGTSSGEKDDTRFVKLVKGGVEYNNAADIEQTLQNIKPSNGKSVRDLDKIVAIAEMPIGEDEKDIAFKVILNEKAYEKYKQAIDAGLLSVQYADFIKELDRINDNSSVSQDEFISAVYASGINLDVARQLWYARGWKTTSPWG